MGGSKRTIARSPKEERVKILLTPTAESDLGNIERYLLDEEGPNICEHVRSGLQAAFVRLKNRPGIGHRRPDLVPDPWRVHRVFAYLIIYRLVDDAIEVAHVLHAARDIPAILKLEPPTAE